MLAALSPCLSLLRLTHQSTVGRGLKQHNNFFHSSGGWKSWSGPVRVGFWWERPSWLADSCLLTVSLHGGERELTSSLLFSLLRTLILLNQGPTYMTSFSLNYFHRGPISKIQSNWGTVLQHEFGETLFILWQSPFGGSFPCITLLLTIPPTITSTVGDVPWFLLIVSLLWYLI